MSQFVKTHLPCPTCDSSDGYSIADDGHGYCFVCKTYVPTLGEEEEETTQTESPWASFTLEYLPWRGISEKTMRKYGVKTRVDGEGKPHSHVYPMHNATQYRLLDTKRFWSEGAISKAGVFGKERFSAGSAPSVTICEGASDAMSGDEMLGGRYPFVSVQSSTSAKRDCTIDYDYINSFDRINICMDNDEPGIKAAKEIASLFDVQKVYFVKLTLKDVNDYLEAGRQQEFKNVWYNAKRYRPDNVISTLAEFKEALRKTPTQTGVAYPFKCLNDKLFGMRGGEVTLVTAPSGVGKSAFIKEIEYACLTNTDDNIALIHLEENKTRTLESFVGFKLGEPVHIPTCIVSDDEKEAVIEELVGRDDRLQIYSHFGSDDPNELTNMIRFFVSAAGCKHVFFDHITMVTSGSGQEERVPLDELSTKLRMLVEELQFNLVLVSQLNEKGGTRGSKNISFIADQWIDLSRDVEATTEAERIKTHVAIKKNRFFSDTGPTGVLKFNKSTFRLYDAGDPVASMPPLRVVDSF